MTLHKLQTSGSGGLQATGALGYESVTMRYRPQDAKGGFGNWIEGSFSVRDNSLTFSGDPQVIQGLFAAGGRVSLSAIAAPVPEPAQWLLLGSGALLLAAVRRRRVA